MFLDWFAFVGVIGSYLAHFICEKIGCLDLDNRGRSIIAKYRRPKDRFRKMLFAHYIGESATFRGAVMENDLKRLRRSLPVNPVTHM